MNIFMIVVLFVVFILSWTYLKLQRKYSYWKNKNIPHPKPTLILGNYGDYILLRKFIGQVAKEICEEFPNEPMVGAYFGTDPALILQDPELIKLVTTKDFNSFNSRENMEYYLREPAGQSLFFIYGDRWKVTRQNLTPLFSSLKMKNMFRLIAKCSHQLEDMLEYETQSDSIDVTTLMARYTMDCIVSCAFGVDSNTMKKGGKNNTFRILGDKIFEASYLRGWFFAIRSVWPALFYGVGLKILPTSIMKFFHEFITDVFKGREYKPSSRNDFVDLVLSWKANKSIKGDSFDEKKAKIEIEVDDELLVIQCVLFFAAGFETSATALGFTLYELAKDEEAQRKAIEEVDAYIRRHDGKLGYECVSELPYLEACIDETLRLYPVLAVITREVVKNYTFPSGLSVEKGMRIHIPVFHMHRHPDFFPEPEVFRPERFLSKEKSIKPYTYMPFGEGPRICLGMRFAKMQMLSCLVTVLKRYRLELAEGMSPAVVFDARSFVIHSKGGLHLKFVQREFWEQRMFNRQPKTVNGDFQNIL